MGEVGVGVGVGGGVGGWGLGVGWGGSREFSLREKREGVVE